MGQQVAAFSKHWTEVKTKLEDMKSQSQNIQEPKQVQSCTKKQNLKKVTRDVTSTSFTSGQMEEKLPETF